MGGLRPSFFAILGETYVKISTNIAFNGMVVALLTTPRNEIMSSWKVSLNGPSSGLFFYGPLLMGRGNLKCLTGKTGCRVSSSIIAFGVDGASIKNIYILTGLLIPICVLISLKAIKFLIEGFLSCLLFIEELLIRVIAVLDSVGFYILFEGILIPMFLIIGIWGL